MGNQPSSGLIIGWIRGVRSMLHVQLVLPTLDCLDVPRLVMWLSRTNGQFDDIGVATITSFMLALLEPEPGAQHGRDVILWKVGDDDYQDNFSSAKTWEQICLRKEPVRWSKVVWFTQGVPQFSLSSWLAVKNRISSDDRMRSWGMIQGSMLCGEVDETRDHLFFACPYSFTV